MKTVEKAGNSSSELITASTAEVLGTLCEKSSAFDKQTARSQIVGRPPPNGYFLLLNLNPALKIGENTPFVLLPLTL